MLENDLINIDIIDSHEIDISYETTPELILAGIFLDEIMKQWLKEVLENGATN